MRTLLNCLLLLIVLVVTLLLPPQVNAKEDDELVTSSLCNAVTRFDQTILNLPKPQASSYLNVGMLEKQYAEIETFSSKAVIEIKAMLKRMKASGKIQKFESEFYEQAQGDKLPKALLDEIRKQGGPNALLEKSDAIVAEMLAQRKEALAEARKKYATSLEFIPSAYALSGKTCWIYLMGYVACAATGPAAVPCGVAMAIGWGNCHLN